MKAPDEIWTSLLKSLSGYYELKPSQSFTIPYIRKALHDEQIAQIIKDATDEDTEIRNLITPYLSEHEVYGDSYGVPTIPDVVKSLVGELAERDKRIAVLEQALDECTIEICKQCKINNPHDNGRFCKKCNVTGMRNLLDSAKAELKGVSDDER